MSVSKSPLFRRILQRSPFSERELVVLIATAPSRYKTHLIDKRGGRGKREISQPTKEVKFLQRLLVSDELSTLPIHSAAVAYRSKMSIMDHAEPHAMGRYLLKLDFKDFFPSLKFQALDRRLSVDTNYSPVERWILGNLLCRQDFKTNLLQLSIGAPSSPLISNYLLYEFDIRTMEYCNKKNVRYTRYADDLAFSTSTPGLLDDIQNFIRNLIIELAYLGLTINESKTVNVSKKRRRLLVGLTLSNDGHASIGRNVKRELRATMHNWSLGKLNEIEYSRLKGRLAFVLAIDPNFVISMLKKYGYTSLRDLGRI